MACTIPLLWFSFLAMSGELYNSILSLVVVVVLLLFSDDGISIPCEYTSFLAPISAPKLHYEVSQSNDSGKGPLVTDSFFCHSLKCVLRVYLVVVNFGS